MVYVLYEHRYQYCCNSIAESIQFFSLFLRIWFAQLCSIMVTPNCID